MLGTSDKLDKGLRGAGAIQYSRDSRGLVANFLWYCGQTPRISLYEM